MTSCSRCGRHAPCPSTGNFLFDPSAIVPSPAPLLVPQGPVRLDRRSTDHLAEPVGRPQRHHHHVDVDGRGRPTLRVQPGHQRPPQRPPDHQATLPHLPGQLGGRHQPALQLRPHEEARRPAVSRVSRRLTIRHPSAIVQSTAPTLPLGAMFKCFYGAHHFMAAVSLIYGLVSDTNVCAKNAAASTPLTRNNDKSGEARPRTDAIEASTCVQLADLTQQPPHVHGASKSLGQQRIVAGDPSELHKSL
jgi:hypothetical protein